MNRYHIALNKKTPVYIKVKTGLKNFLGKVKLKSSPKNIAAPSSRPPPTPPPPIPRGLEGRNQNADLNNLIRQASNSIGRQTHYVRNSEELQRAIANSQQGDMVYVSDEVKGDTGVQGVTSVQGFTSPGYLVQRDRQGNLQGIPGVQGASNEQV